MNIMIQLQQIIKIIIKKFLIVLVPKYHLGIIMTIDIKSNFQNDLSIYKNRINLINTSDKEIIYNNLVELGVHIREKDLVNYLSNNTIFWFAFDNNNSLIGSECLLFNSVKHESFSGRVFSKKQEIVFHNNIGYVRFEKINDSIVGEGYGTEMFQNMLLKIKELRNKHNIDKIIATMGADNISNIKKWQRFNARIVGIVAVFRVFGIIIRKEYFIDKCNKCWE